MALAGWTQYRVCLLAVVPLGACTGWEDTLHQLLHSQKVSAISMGVSAQFPKVFTLH